MSKLINLYPLPVDEAKELEEDNFYWVEFRKGNYGVDEDEPFYLLAKYKTNYDIDFSAPNALINCNFEDYGKTWRIWNLYPSFTSEEYAEAIWED